MLTFINLIISAIGIVGIILLISFTTYALIRYGMEE
jgi:hypothetical protein